MAHAEHSRRIVWGVGAGIVVVVSAIALFVTRSAPQPLAYPVPGTIDTITVEVLNGAGVSELARETTLRLRRLGVDVVYYGTARDSIRQTTEVLARRGDTVAARRIVEKLGFGQVLDRPDERRLLDVSVYLGLDAAAERKRTITIEVLNGAGVNGLARLTTQYLRRAGFLVPTFGTARDSVWRTTEVIARRGDIEAARQVMEALGVGAVKDASNRTLGVDVSVILGQDAASDTLRFKP